MGRRQKITTWRRYNWLAYAKLMEFSSDVREQPLFQSSLAVDVFDRLEPRVAVTADLFSELSFQLPILWRRGAGLRRKRCLTFQSPMPVIYDSGVWQLLSRFIAASNHRQLAMRSVLNRNGPGREVGRQVWLTLQTRISPLANVTFSCSQEAVRCVTHHFREYP